MQILMLNHNVAFTGGGTFFRALHLSRQLARRRHHVTLVSSSPNARRTFRERELDGVHLVEAPGLLPPRWRYGYDFYEAAQRMRWVAQRKFEIVHAFDSRPTVIYPALTARRNGACLVMDWCDWFGQGGAVEERTNFLLRTLLRPVETYYEQAFRRHAHATTVINQALEERARGLGVPPQSILRMPQGADLERLHPQSQAEARAALNLPMDAPLLGHVGALFQADAQLLIQTFQRVRAVWPEARLILIGNPKANLSMTEAIIRTGFVDYAKLNCYLAACDILCLPLTDSVANRGRFPSKITDYFAVGRPTVAGAVGEVWATLQTTRAGLVADPTPESFSAQILSLLDNASLRVEMGHNARRTAESDFNWEHLAEQLEALYVRVLATK